MYQTGSDLCPIFEGNVTLRGGVKRSHVFSKCVYEIGPDYSHIFTYIAIENNKHFSN